jgi:hypothetical protein
MIEVHQEGSEQVQGAVEERTCIANTASPGGLASGRAVALGALR